jgi:hypothetical protein
VETLAALRALEHAAVGTRGYVPPDAVDELATALEDFEALSADPSLLLGDNEKEKVEDIVDRATVVLESMNRDKWAEGGAVMTVAVVHVNWSRAEIVGALAALRRGVEPEGTERVRVSGHDATLVVWSPDYDGKGKAWVRFDGGTDAIVGGSRVER